MNGTVGEMEQLSSWPLNLISTHLLKGYTLNFDSEDQHLQDLFHLGDVFVTR